MLVVDLKIADLDGEVVVGMPTNLLVHLVDCSWDDASVLVVRRRPVHRERLACSGLPVAHHGAVVAIGHLLDGLEGAVVEDILLGRVVHDLVELELPVLGGVVDETSALVLRNVNGHVLQINQNEVSWSERIVK